MSKGTVFVDLGTDDPRVIGLKVTGKATAETITPLVEKLESLKDSGTKARLYLDLSQYEGSELSVAREKLAHMSAFWNSIERCAYVIDQEWMSTLIGLVDAVTPMHLRAFSTDRDAEARAWILENVECT